VIRRGDRQCDSSQLLDVWRLINVLIDVLINALIDVAK
jgi:hypothetical protein